MNNSMHRLLNRQLRKLGLDAKHTPDAASWAKLLPIIGRTYLDADLERYTLERSLAISSEEMQALYQRQKSSYEARLQTLFVTIQDPIWLKDPEGVYLACNPIFARLFGAGEADIIGKSDYDFFDEAIADAFHAKDMQVIEAQKSCVSEEWVTFADDGHRALLETIQTPMLDETGKLIGVLGIARDITERKQHEEQLAHIAHYDALTSLPNRVLLADRLHQAMTQAQRRGQRLAVAYLDLDGFKTINDSHGHDVGDQLLMIVGQRMKQALREGDTLARIGGDEFIAVLQDLIDIESSVPLVNRLLAAAAQPIEVGNLMLQVSASLGITFYPQMGEQDVDADQLLRQADQAMYQAKLAGKNRYHLFDTQQDGNIRGQHESLEAIRRALIGREFMLYYQPKVNMRTGAVVGAEALIRWQHPEKGLLPSGEFLSVIEDHPLAVEIGEWVIDTALAQIALWHQAGLDLTVSVNVGALQLQHANFVTNLRDMLAAHPNVKPNRLEIEVLETSALIDIVHVSQVMAVCHEIGVSFALDDFGTGYSSLTYLKRLPVARLKIDQSFVRNMLDDPDDLAILDGVLALAITFNRDVIAEGVETVESGAMLLQMGCDYAQGYVIARPMPAHEMIAWVASWQPDVAWADKPPVSRANRPILFAEVEHRAWVAAITAFLKGGREISPPLDPHQCRFGLWLDTDGIAHHKTQPAFQAVITLHRQVHTLSAKLLTLHAQGKNAEALTQLDELHELRDELLEQLKLLLCEARQ